MKNFLGRLSLVGVLVFIAPQALADTYRYMHVTIDTPWAIFLGLLVAVLLPFILMAVLYWHTAFRRNAEADAENNESVAVDVEGKGSD